MYERAKSEFGRVDVLFNNAGINATDDQSAIETTLEAWQRVQAEMLLFGVCEFREGKVLRFTGASETEVKPSKLPD